MNPKMNLDGFSWPTDTLDLEARSRGGPWVPLRSEVPPRAKRGQLEGCLAQGECGELSGPPRVSRSRFAGSFPIDGLVVLVNGVKGAGTEDSGR